MHAELVTRASVIVHDQDASRIDGHCFVDRGGCSKVAKNSAMRAEEMRWVKEITQPTVSLSAAKLSLMIDPTLPLVLEATS